MLQYDRTRSPSYVKQIKWNYQDSHKPAWSFSCIERGTIFFKCDIHWSLPFSPRGSLFGSRFARFWDLVRKPEKSWKTISSCPIKTHVYIGILIETLRSIFLLMGKLTIHHQFGFLVMWTFSEHDFIALFELPRPFGTPSRDRRGWTLVYQFKTIWKGLDKLSGFYCYPLIFNSVKYWLWSYLWLIKCWANNAHRASNATYICMYTLKTFTYYIDVYIDREGERRSGFPIQCTFFAVFLHISTTSETITIKQSICIYVISLPFPTNPISTSNLTCN